MKPSVATTFASMILALLTPQASQAAITNYYSASTVVRAARLASAPVPAQGVRYILDFNPATTTLPTTTASYDSGPVNFLGEVHPGGRGQATVTANLAIGRFGAYASGAVLAPDSSAVISAQAIGGYTDTLSFSIPGASAATLTPVSFSITSEGSMRIDSHYADSAGFEDASLYSSRLGLSIRGHDETAGKIVNVESRLGYVQTDSGTSTFPSTTFSMGTFGTPDFEFFTSFEQAADNPSFSVRLRPRQPTDSTDAIEVTALLAGANPTLTLTLAWSAATYGGEVDFLHTASLAIDVPAGVSWTSESGALLSAQAVPEAGTAATTAAGLAVLAVVARRRRLVGAVRWRASHA